MSRSQESGALPALRASPTDHEQKTGQLNVAANFSSTVGSGPAVNRALGLREHLSTQSRPGGICALRRLDYTALAEHDPSLIPLDIIGLDTCEIYQTILDLAARHGHPPRDRLGTAFCLAAPLALLCSRPPPGDTLTDAPTSHASTALLADLRAARGADDPARLAEALESVRSRRPGWSSTAKPWAASSGRISWTTRVSVERSTL